MMQGNTIKDITFFDAVSSVSVPIADATHSIPSIRFIIAEIRLANGITGQGYLLSFHYSPNAIRGALADIKNFILEHDYEVSATKRLYNDWLTESEYFGQEGINRWAVAIINVAMWDAWGKANAQNIIQLLQGRKQKIPVYGSGGWLSYSDEELTEEVTDYKKRGFRSVKIKVGSDDPERDIHRLHKVREAIGPDINIMMDANQGMQYPAAKKLAEEAVKLNVVWFEEPFHHRDYVSYEQLKTAARIKLAMGEREYDTEALKILAEKKALDLWQPDIIRLGGVERWLSSARLAATYNIPTLPHYYKDYDTPLLCTISSGYAVESFDWIDGLIDNPMEIRDGYAIPRDGTGWGFSFLHNKLNETGYET